MNTTQPKFDLSEEIKVIHPVAWVVAVALFCCMQWVWHVFMLSHEHNPPPFVFRLIMGFFTGILLSVVSLLVGYVNRDSARRGMNRVLWTLLVIFIPNALGFILYFFVRQPITTPCPKCGNPTQASFHFCPACQYKLKPVCDSCGAALQPEWRCCPTCGKNSPALAST